MALTAAEEALVRQLLDEQAALISLATQEATIISKLGATKVTLADLAAAGALGDTDLYLLRQGANDVSVTGAVLKAYAIAGVDLSNYVQLTGDQTVGGVKTFSSTIILPTSGAGLVPPGAWVDFSLAAPPAGYLLRHGANVSRATYAALFAAIGTTHGVGDGSTTFTLPDSRRRTSVGSGGTGTGTLGNAVGNVGGAETHTLSIAELAAHTHGNTNGAGDGAGGAGGNFASSANNGQTASTGSNTAHNNMQPSIIVLPCIKY